MTPEEFVEEIAKANQTSFYRTVTSCWIEEHRKLNQLKTSTGRVKA
jgi:hypothetical protein